MATEEIESCRVEGCTRQVRSKGFCQSHYNFIYVALKMARGDAPGEVLEYVENELNPNPSPGRGITMAVPKGRLPK